MATARDYFETDFKHEVVANNVFDFQWNADQRLIAVPVQLHYDFDANAVFVCFYLPVIPAPEFVRDICGHVNRVLAIGEGRDIRSGKHGELQARAEDLVFTGRVFVYAEDDLSDAEIENIADTLRRQGLFFRFRGRRYARERSASEKPLAFISYDSSDRDTVAAPLAQALAAIRCPAWFDEYMMRAGDPIERTIFKGLNDCERCLVVLSARYLENQRWARREFDAIAEREVRENRSLIIPILHGVDKQQVVAFSPVLAHRRSLKWDPARVSDIASDISVTLRAIGRPHELNSGSSK